MIKEIEYKGMTAASSDYSCADGELDVSLSVDTSNGEGQAEYNPSTEFTLPSAYWRVMVIHETADYKHYILANTESGKTHYLSYIDAADTTKVVGIDNKGKYIASGWVIKSVTPMGNTLVVTSENPETEEGDMCYFLWRNGKYVALGSEIPDIAIQFNLSARGKFYSQQIYDADGMADVSSTYNTVNNGTFKIKITGRPDTGVCEFTEAQQDEVSSYVSGRVTRFINEVGNKAGRFIYPFFARYAYRLYDGTYTMQSAPVLMCPCSGTMPIVVASNNAGSEGADNMANGDIFATPCVLGWNATDSDALSKLKSDWKDIVQEVCIFVSPPIYTYDQSKKPTGLSLLRKKDAGWSTPSYENLMLACMNYGQNNSSSDTDYEDPEGYNNNFYDRNKSDAFNDGMRTIEYAMTYNVFDGKMPTDTAAVYQWWDVYELFKMFYWGARQYDGEGQPSLSLYRIDLPEFDKDELQRKFKEESKFYLLKEYEVSKMTDKASIQHLDPQYLGALSAHEALPDDFLSHEKKYPKVVRAYNSRLNIANITRYAYDGYPLASMFPRQTLFRDMAVLRDSDAKGKSGAEWLATVFKSPKDYDGTTTVRYTLETSSGKTIVVGNEASMKESFRYVNLDDVVLSDDTTITKTSRALPMFFYYPSPMCKKVEVFQDAQCILSAKMEEHSFLYGSFCLVGTAGDKDLPSSSTTQRTATALSTDKTIHLPNTVYLSEVNNPFSFLAVNAVTAGSGSIVGIVPAVEAVSQGQFGQYPMYALTDEGVWSLMPNDSGIYSTSRPVSRDVCNNPDSVLQVDHSVLFTTDRGIVSLAGSQSTCITDTLDSLIASKALSLKSLATYLTSQNISTSSLPSATFREFLKGASEVYDYTNRRIIVYNPTQTADGSLKYAYAYVYYIKSNKWGLIPSSIVSATNSYPDAIVQDADGNVLNYSALDYTKTQPGVIVTRPLKLGEPGTMKTIVAIIQRGRFLKDHVAQILYGSNDLVNWYAVWSSSNMYMRGFSGTPYKYFRIVVHATLDTGETLDGCTVQFFEKMTNQLR